MSGKKLDNVGEAEDDAELTGDERELSDALGRRWWRRIWGIPALQTARGEGEDLGERDGQGLGLKHGLGARPRRP